ncbi:family 2 glycosyl transferase [Paenibacillus sp. FSL R7-277]|uniref:glycosyltransferase family 2 protein n=1 Tax=unclassified Paenibacillus TaxID=185978 RepID=UPI0003E1FA74|nr:glycosyltransferase [Paenibacillus sp. FSL R7-277]ETT65453.1 family 2 glycosyl transferase [Paenibacillus sp. FSL R7-277]
MRKYSIVIVTYQMRETLRNTLEALNYMEGFGRDEFEVIVSDDGSMDGTQEYVQGINRNYEMKYIFTERSQLSCRNRARNLGIKEAGGEIIICMDGDVLANKNLLSEFDRCYSMDSNIVVAGARIMLERNVEYEAVHDQSIFMKHRFDGSNNESLDDRYRKYNVLSYNSNAMRHPWLMAHTNIVSIPKAYINKVGLFSEEIKGWGFDESELMYRLFKAGVKFIINHKIEVLHQPHNEMRDTPENVKVIEFTNNISLFFKKYPDALNQLPENLTDYFMNDQMLELLTPAHAILRRIELNLKQTEELLEIKQVIIKCLNEEGLELVVYDYIESTDLDIYIQLLGETRSVIKYFPMSKKLTYSTVLDGGEK